MCLRAPAPRGRCEGYRSRALSGRGPELRVSPAAGAGASLSLSTHSLFVGHGTHRGQSVGTAPRRPRWSAQTLPFSVGTSLKAHFGEQTLWGSVRALCPEETAHSPTTPGASPDSALLTHSTPTPGATHGEVRDDRQNTTTTLICSPICKRANWSLLSPWLAFAL